MTDIIGIDPASVKPQAVAWRSPGTRTYRYRFEENYPDDKREFWVAYLDPVDLLPKRFRIAKRQGCGIVVCEGGYVGPHERIALDLEHVRGMIHAYAHAAGLKFYSVAVSTWQNACLPVNGYMPKGPKEIAKHTIFRAKDICGQKIDVDRATAVCIADWAECNRVIVEEGAR